MIIFNILNIEKICDTIQNKFEKNKTGVISGFLNVKIMTLSLIKVQKMLKYNRR